MTVRRSPQGRDASPRIARSRSATRSLAAMVSLTLVAGACTHRGGDGSPGTSSSPADRFGRVVVGPQDHLQLGILLGLSGTDPSVGIAALHGAQLALDYLDGTFDAKPGPLMEHPINLEIEDDRCSADGSRAGAEELASDPRVVGVVGMSCTTAAVGGADRILSDRGVLLISPANTEPSLTAEGTHQPFFLRTAHNEALDGVVMADLARGTANAQTAAVVHDDGAASLALADVFTARFEAKGGTVTTSASVGVDGDGIGQVLDDIGKTPPGFLFVPGSDPTCAAVVRQAQDLSSLGSTTFGSSSDCEGSFRPTADATEGGSFLSTPDRSTVESGEFYRLQFVPAYESQFGTGVVPVVSAYAFDAANILFDAMQVSAKRSDDGSLVFQRSALRDAIFATDSYEGLTGPLTCTPLGDCAAPVRFAVYPASELPSEGQEPSVKPVFTEVVSADDLNP
jgi:branched-chain amino acid transport system substrate-binding protein